MTDEWKVEPHTRDKRGRITWYAIQWQGEAVSYLADGKTLGKYRRKGKAQAHCDALNRSLAKTVQ
jgi:hypothetical protein